MDLPRTQLAPASDILTIAVGGASDPDGSNLRRLLERELAYERSRVSWQRWLWVFAAATGIRWLVWPQLVWTVPVAWHWIATPLWMAVSARAALAAILLSYRSRRWDDALASHPAADVRSAPTD